MKNIYILGICGTGMGTLAIMLKKEGYNVFGSDKNIYPPMSNTLKDNKIKILTGYKKENIKDNYDLVIIGNVIRKDNEEANEIIKRKIPYISLPEAIKKFFIKDKKSIVVTGTHGKTTSSFMMSWVLENANKNPGFFVGGISKNFNISGRSTDSNYFVTEGDEYDTVYYDKVPKFYHYSTKYLIINSIEFDHIDIYKNIDEIKKVFLNLIKMIPSDGVIVYNYDDKNIKDLIKHAKCKTISFSRFNKNAYFYSSEEKIIYENKKTYMSFNVNNEEYRMQIPGTHNVLNALSVIAMAEYLKIKKDDIKKAFLSFKSVKRRQEVYGIVNGRIIIDDFAHHPSAVAYTIDAIKKWYKDKNIWCILEPRTATFRTNKLEDETIKALSNGDKIILSSVHLKDRVKEEERFSPKRVTERLKQIGKLCVYKENVNEILKYLKENTLKGDVILIMSNGGFDNIYEKLMKAF
jgi:UDP-N-acetylmuramate: L-alanyl-gamma-D-glutamyl-meso-diaminopimelate ligase